MPNSSVQATSGGRFTTKALRGEPLPLYASTQNRREWLHVSDHILAELDLPASLKTIVPDRPSHDRRYLLYSSKIRGELGWRPQISFADGVRATVGWYREYPEWWQPPLGRLPVQESEWAQGGGSSAG